MRKIIIFIICIFLIFSCSKENENKINVKRIGFISFETTGNARNQIIKGTIKALQNSDVYLKEYKPIISNNKVDQISAMERAIKDECFAIIISPISKKTLDSIVNMAIKNNIIVIVIQSGIYNKYSKLTISSNIEIIANKLELYFDDIKNKDNILMISVDPNNSYYNKLALKIQKYCQENNLGYNIYFSNQNVSKTEKFICDYLKKHQNSIVVSCEVTSKIPFDKLKKEHPKLNIFTFDSSLEQIKNLENNNIKSIIVEDYFSMGYIATKAILNILESKNINKKVNTKFIILTKDTMFLESTQWILFSTK